MNLETKFTISRRIFRCTTISSGLKSKQIKQPTIPPFSRNEKFLSYQYDIDTIAMTVLIKSEYNSQQYWLDHR